MIKNIAISFLHVYTFVLIVCLTGCQQAEQAHTRQEVAPQSIDSIAPPPISFESVEAILAGAMRLDSLAHDAWDPFICFRSGFYGTRSEKQAIIIQRENDSGMWVQLFELDDTTWVTKSTLRGLPDRSVYFNVALNDFNFDGQADLYINAATSNGYSLSTGYLITIHPQTRQMQLHKEASGLANMRPDPRTQLVYSDALVSCDPVNMPDVSTWENSWINNTLVTTKKSDPCRE